MRTSSDFWKGTITSSVKSKRFVTQHYVRPVPVGTISYPQDPLYRVHDWWKPGILGWYPFEWSVRVEDLAKSFTYHVTAASGAASRVASLWLPTEYDGPPLQKPGGPQSPGHPDTTAPGR